MRPSPAPPVFVRSAFSLLLCWIFVLFSPGLSRAQTTTGACAGVVAALRNAQTLDPSSPLKSPTPVNSTILYCYAQQAQQGDPVAQYLYGSFVFYGNRYNGFQITRDYGEARGWFEKAAAQNYSGGWPAGAVAELMLGHIFERGLGTAVDLSQALSWYQKSAAQGNSAAQKCASDLEKWLAQGAPGSGAESAAATGAAAAVAAHPCPAGSRWDAGYGGYCAPNRPPLTAIDANTNVSTLTPEDVKSLLVAAQSWQLDRPDKNATRGLDKWDAKQLKQSWKDCNVLAKQSACEDVASKLRTPDPGYDSMDFTASQAHYQVYQALFRACALANSQGSANQTEECSSLAQAIGYPTENFAGALAVADNSPSCVSGAPKGGIDWCVNSAFFSVSGAYNGYFSQPARIQKVGEDLCQRTTRGCADLASWKLIAAQQQQGAQNQAQADASEQANNGTPDRQAVQDKIDSLNSEIQRLESDANDADHNADNLAANSNCVGGFGPYAAIARQGCENINSIGVAKFRSEAAKDRNQADDDRSEIARLQGEEVQEAPHRDASFGGALAQQMQQNPQPSIVDTANQQAANMVALGAANDAARAQAAQQRATEQREEEAREQAQQQAAAARAQAAAQAAQQAQQQAAASSNSSSAGNSNSTGAVTCLNESGFVTATSKLNSDGFAVGFLTNNSNLPLYVTFTFARGGQPAKDETGSVTLKPGQTYGGEGGGIWATTGGASAVDSSPVKLYWFAVPQSESNQSCGLLW
ncbi:MAG: sel1 repeat family protein [Acidobacteriota bacterium]|nr:sel1 repeat family protein [Acidobacteriota bacterium]